MYVLVAGTLNRVRKVEDRAFRRYRPVGTATGRGGTL